MLTTVDRQTDGEEDIRPLQERDLESVSALLSLSPTLRIATPPPPPPRGVKHLLVMTMPQTALLSLSAFLERQCNSAKKASA